MAIDPKLLNEGEHVVFTTRSHVKALLLPAVLLIVLAGLGGYLSTLPSGDLRAPLVIAIWVLVLAVAARYVLWPFLGWLTATYTVTNRRLITRNGILTRRGHDIPINRISEVATERDLIDRMLGCGTLVISDASELGRVVLHDIPDAERMSLMLSQELHGSSRHDDGT